MPDLLGMSSGTPSIVVITSTGNGAGELLYGVETVRIQAAQILLDLVGDHRRLRLDGARREHLVEQAAHVAVLGRVHEDDHSARRLRQPFLIVARSTP